MLNYFWLEKEVIHAFHREQLAEHGGIEGIRDETLLDSALAKPKQLCNYADPPPSLAELAASYAFGIAKNHAYFDGNKRTAAIACETFLALHGFRVEASQEEKYDKYIALASGSIGETEFAHWLDSKLELTQ